jgi:hypothetical protein
MRVRLSSSKGSKLGAIAGFVATTGMEKRSTALSGLVMWIFAPGLSGGAEEILRNLTRPSHRCRSVMSVRYADHNWKAVGTPVAPDGGRSQCQLDAFGRHDACCTEHRCSVRPSGRLGRWLPVRRRRQKPNRLRRTLSSGKGLLRPAIRIGPSSRGPRAYGGRRCP